MNARETLQALLDGKTIIGSSGHLWKLDEYDGLIYRKPEKKAWQESPMVFNGDCEVYEEYPLTFEEALRAMLDGKVVICNYSSDARPHRFHDGVFQFLYCNEKWSPAIWFEEKSQKAKWKVVE